MPLTKNLLKLADPADAINKVVERIMLESNMSTAIININRLNKHVRPINPSEYNSLESLDSSIEASSPNLPYQPQGNKIKYLSSK